jgi:hypothetical protein
LLPLRSATFREFDNGIPLAWVKDRTVVMQLSLGTGTRILRDGFTPLTIPPLTRSRLGPAPPIFLGEN